MKRNRFLEVDGVEILLRLGKHKGEELVLVAEKDPGYLEWLLKLDDLPEDVAEAIEDVLS